MSTNGDTRLVIEDVTHRYGKVAALDDVSLAIEDGELVTLLGPSGCGKTTLLRIIAGFIKPSSGRILLQGRDVTRLPPHKRPVNMVFQRATLFPHLDVYGNVAFGLQIAGLEKDEVASRVSEVLSLVRLEGLRASPRTRAVGRPAAAGRAGPRARQPAAGAPARRAAVGARPQDPPRDGGRAPPRAPRDGRDLRLRHTRPARGARALRPDRRLRPRARRAGRPARRDLPLARLPLRGAVRRRRERDPGRGDRSLGGAWRPCGCPAASWPSLRRAHRSRARLARRPAGGRPAQRAAGEGVPGRCGMRPIAARASPTASRYRGSTTSSRRRPPPRGAFRTSSEPRSR